jgi:hypothetical protein
VPEPLPQTAEAESEGEDEETDDAEEAGEGLRGRARVAYWPIVLKMSKLIIPLRKRNEKTK